MIVTIKKRYYQQSRIGSIIGTTTMVVSIRYQIHPYSKQICLTFIIFGDRIKQYVY